MTQVILRLENNIKAKRLIDFLYSLDFVKVEDSLKIKKDKSGKRITKEKDTLFFSSAGSWKDIDTEKLKNEIYKNRKISKRKKIQL